MNIVETCHEDIPMEQRSTRPRKLAVGHHSNNMLFDTNCNALAIVCPDSVSDILPNAPNTPTETNEDVSQNHERDSVVWENTVLQQIQRLIKKVQISDSLADYIRKEILSGPDVNANAGLQTRRKSCFSFNNDSHRQTTRRQSIAGLQQTKSKSLPRTNCNNIDIFDYMPLPQRRRQSDTRRSTVVQDQGTRSSAVSHHGVRRSSVVHPGGNVAGHSGRRNSVSTFSGSRSSLSRAYQHSAMPSFRRIKNMNEHFVSMPINGIPQRRRSIVNPPCVPVTKIYSVQKRLHKIYNRKSRRLDRAEVIIADVRKAFKELRKDEGGDTSASEDGNKSNFETVNGSNSEIVDENSNPCEVSDTFTANTEGSESKIKKELITEVMTEDMRDNISEYDNEHASVTRRRMSIQVRSWELSRRIRQRRRQNRKGFTESNLI